MVQFAVEDPAGQARPATNFAGEGSFVSSLGVRSIWSRHKLANRKQRLNRLVGISVRKGIVLTEAQVQALERKEHDDEVCRERKSLSRLSG